jgi:hypothetical protein
MAFHAEIARAFHPLNRFINKFITRITCGNRKLRAFFDIDDDGNSKLCAVRPANVWFRAMVAAQVTI